MSFPNHAGLLSAIPSTWHRQIAPAMAGNRTGRPWPMIPSLPVIAGVIVLQEVDGMARLACPLPP